MLQTSLFDWTERLKKIDKNGDPLMLLDRSVNWELFREELEKIREKDRKSKAGAKSYDVVLMFKVLILQSLYNLSDDATEYQILDRLSFMRFLGLKLGKKVPDAKTIWLFREELTRAGLAKKLFSRFDECLNASGFKAEKGQIIDASIVSVPKQRNKREENKKIKEGEIPEGWSEAKRRQKDTDARWTKKASRSYYGYKNHINVDAKYKLIREYEVTDASVHDSKVFEEVLSDRNSSRDVWADSAYRSQEIEENLKRKKYRSKIHRKGSRNNPLTSWEKQGNRTRSKVRARVEHIFGVQAQMAGNLILRCIGIIRAMAKIGLRNLAFNMMRYKTLLALGK